MKDDEHKSRDKYKGFGKTDKGKLFLRKEGIP